MQGRLSLRERLVIVMVIAVLPVAGVSLWLAVRDSRTAAELTQSQARFAASLLAGAQDRAADAAEQMLGAIATVPDLRSGGRGPCQAYFERLRARLPVYTNIGLIASDGQVLCHAQGALGDAPASDRDYFREAIAQRRFVMGQPIVGRLSGRRALPFALPVIAGEQVTGVVFATLDLDRAALALNAVELPRGAQVLVADRLGTVLMEYPRAPGTAPGRRLNDPAFTQAARTFAAAAGESTDAAGDAVIEAFAPSRPIGPQGFVVRVSIQKSAITAGSLADRLDAALLVALVLFAAMGLTWVLGGRMIVKPAKQILGTVRRLEQGNLEARVPLFGGTHRGEFARIAGAFNLMAESLQLRQANLEAELGRSRGAYDVLDQVLNSMEEGLIAVTAGGQFLMFNAAAARLFELNGAPTLPQLWPEHFGFFHADGVTPYQPEELPLVRSALGESGQRQVFVRNALVPGGRLLQCGWQPIHADEGVRGGLVVFTDVTELQRLQAEQAVQFAQLEETQRRLVEAQRVGRVGNWELDLRNGHLWWSDEVYTLFGIGRGDFDGSVNGFMQWVHPEDRSLLKPARDSALRDGQVMNVQYRVVRPDGSIAWMQEIAEARRGEGGEPTWFGGMVQDVTEHVRLFEQIRELNATLEARIAERTAELVRQEQLYRTLAEQAPEVIWNTDAAGERLTFLNRAWYELVGGPPERWLGHSGADAIHPDDREEVRAKWRHSLATRSPFVGERRLLGRDGTYHTMAYKGMPVFDEQGGVASWIGIDADVTEFKLIEAALRSSNQELEAFSYSVSHDLRAPLGAIAGFSRAVATRLEGSTDERVTHYLDRIQAGVEKMEQLIEALLSLSKVVRAPLDWGKVDLAAIARETLDALRMQEPERDVEVRVEDSLNTQGDVRLMRVVMQNLLGNAWKFSARTQAAVIEVGRVAGGGAFFVRDNGAGFDMAYASKLFTAFQRLHTDAEFPGTGIGLATVRRIIVRHQGRVWAESRPGEGTTFYFSLPDSPPPPWLAAKT